MSARTSRPLKRHLTRLAARMSRRPSLTPAELVALRPQRLLIVRQHNQMGDMVCATPAFRALRSAYPGAEIALVTAPINDAVVRHNPDIDRVLRFDKDLWAHPRRLAVFWRDLRGFRADLAFVLNSVSFSVTSAVLGLVSGAPHVVGGDSRPFGWRISDAYSLVMPAAPDLDCHAVDDNLAPLRSVGITTDDRSTIVVPSPAEQAVAAGLLAEWGWEDGFRALHPGAGKRQNAWPPERFAAVAARAAAAGGHVLVLHGASDRDLLGSFLAALGERPPPEVKVAPEVSVGTAAALLARCERFLCNDTGIMHVAGAVRAPTLALFGPTRPDFWKPPVPEVVALSSPRRTPDPRGGEYGWMENLSVDEVWAAWSALPARSFPACDPAADPHRTA
ncbi:MAG: glycosyltransferase family 9 protein [Candidatus Krumholzibacteriia bacterium]